MSEDTFQERYKSLNKAQREAVDSIEGPVMVIAGPGTGKTTILTLRIANILKKTDTPASGILALTFTDSGVKAMRAKLREVIGGRADDVRIHTFHGFASSVISEFPEHFTLVSRSKQITDVEAEKILRDILKDKKYSKLRPLGDPDFYLHKIISTISDCKKEAWTPEILLKFAKAEIKRVESDEDSISTRGRSLGKLKGDALKRIEKCEKTILLAGVYEEYEAKKRIDKKIDYDDLILELINALQNDELLLQLLQEKFLYILVDEHQDTNDSQNMIIEKLANFFENPNLFVVGDEKQAIYRFQGASVENFLKFQDKWKDMKVISLLDNYRSHQHILDGSFTMIEKNYEDGQYENLRVKLKSGSSEKKKPIDIVFAQNFDSADEFLIEEIKQISKKDGDATVAVILRSNRDVDHVLSLCEVNKIPAKAERGRDIFSHPLGVAYFSLLEYIDDNSNLEALASTVAMGFWGLDFAKANGVIKKIKTGEVASLEKEIPALNTLKLETQKSGVIDYLILLGELSGITSKDNLTNPLSVEVWRGIVDLARDISISSGIEDPKTLVKELLNYKKTAEKKIIKIGGGSSNSKVVIMTAHSSKGLEYDYVFIPYALNEAWTRGNRGSSFVLPREKDEVDELRDARRLFYVAITRARKHVSIIVPKEDNLGKVFTPLGFISELHPDSLKNMDAPVSTLQPKTLTGKDLVSKRGSEIIEYAKNILLENGLSVTALNHFLKCPNQFLYKSILKVPESPTAKSEKGIAMHQAISNVWKNGDKDVESIKNTIENSTKSYLKTSLLPKHEKEAVLDELLADAGTVAKALQSHFAIEGKVFTDRWIDTTLSLKNLGEINLKLHGQMDSIVDTDVKTLVFDYKTREAMSENAIKGQTKDSDGNYFRQLVFYKILLLGNHNFANKNVEPALVFVKPDIKGRCPTITLPVSTEDIEKVKSEINNLAETIFKGEIRGCGEKDCLYCAYRKSKN